MAEIKERSAVLSKAGRDKGRFFAVLSVAGEYAHIADGDLRKVAAPKRKKIKHLGATNVEFTAHEMGSDKALRTAIVSRFGGSDRQ